MCQQIIDLFFGVANVTFHQRMERAPGYLYYLFNYFIIFMVYSARESYNSQTLSFASLRKCMVDLWFILLRNRAIPQCSFHLANQYIVYRYMCILKAFVAYLLRDQNRQYLLL